MWPCIVRYFAYYLICSVCPLWTALYSMGGMSVFMLRLGRSAVTECVQSSPGAAVVSTPPALGWSDFITSVAGTTIVHNTDTTDSFFSRRGKDVQFPVLTWCCKESGLKARCCPDESGKLGNY